MTSFGKTLTAGAAIIIIIAGIALLLTSSPSSQAPAVGNPIATSTTPATTPAPVSSDTLYQNPDLGFSFSYPASFSAVPQNFMDTADHKTLITIGNSDRSQTIRVTVLMNSKTGKPVSADISNYEKALIGDVVFDGSGAHPKSFSEFDMRQLGDARFAHIKTGLFEGVLGESYYAAVPGGIVRFSLNEQGVDWTNPSYDVEQDAGHLALKSMLATFKVGAYSAAASPVSSVSYTDPAGAYSVSVPSGWKANPKFGYDAIGPDKTIPGVSFAIPAAFTAATNLSADSYISIEKNPYAKSCVAAEFTSTATTNPDVVTKTVGGISWNMGESTDVGAGNYYDERVYAAKNGSDCYGIRLFMHSGQVANYDAGAKQQFDKTVLTSIQDKVVASYKFLK